MAKTRLLRAAAGHLTTGGDGAARQQRRLALIRQSVHTPLGPDEAAELAALQAALDRRLSLVDDVLLGELARMQQVAEAGTTPTP